MSDLQFQYFDVDDPTKKTAVIKLWRNDSVVGTIFVNKEEHLPDDPEPYTPCWQVSAIEVVEEYRRKGFGTKLYEEAARIAAFFGKALCSDIPLSLDRKAEAFWEKQVAQGRAYWEVPGPEEREGWNFDYGRFVLRYPPPASLAGRRTHREKS